MASRSKTLKIYVDCVARFARHFNKSPEKLGPEELRTYLLYLMHERKVALGTYKQALSALRFLYRWVLQRGEIVLDIHSPRPERRLPAVLSFEEVHRFFAAQHPHRNEESLPFLEDENNFSFGESDFQQLVFYVEDSESLDVVGVIVLYTEPHRLHVIEAADGKAVLTGSLFVHFLAEIGGIQENIESMALVDAEIALTYNASHPDQIEAQSVKYDRKWGVDVRLPASYRRDNL